VLLGWFGVRFDEREMENEMEGAMEDGKKSTSAAEEGRAGFSSWMLTRMPFCERSYSVLFVILRYQRTRARLDDPCRVGGFLLLAALMHLGRLMVLERM
jgi:hypothetical protein